MSWIGSEILAFAAFSVLILIVKQYARKHDGSAGD